MVRAFMLYRLLALLLLLSRAQSAPAQAYDLRTWAGEYEYSEAEPPDLVMDYIIKVFPDGRATVSVDGHLTTIHLVATARTEGGHALGIFYDRTVDHESPKLRPEARRPHRHTAKERREIFHAMGGPQLPTRPRRGTGRDRQAEVTTRVQGRTTLFTCGPPATMHAAVQAT